MTEVVGQALFPLALTSGDINTSNMGKKIACSGWRACLLKTRLWTCAMAIFDGKQGSMEPRFDPARYMSPVVKSE